MITNAVKGIFEKKCILCGKCPSHYKITKWFFFWEYWCELCFDAMETLRIKSGGGSVKEHFGID